MAESRLIYTHFRDSGVGQNILKRNCQQNATRSLDRAAAFFYPRAIYFNNT